MRSIDWPMRVALAIALSAAGAADAATLIVRASGPSAAAYPPGRMLTDATRIDLKANDELVLLDQQGTRTLRGPGNFSALDGSAPQASSSLAALVNQRSDRRVRIGAVRGVEGKARRPSNIWFVDASRGGTVCVADPAQTMVWRPDPDKPASLTAAAPAGGSAAIDWAAGQAVQSWPKALPVADGAHYSLNGVPVRFAFVGTAPGDVQDMAQVLIKRGCAAQLDLLLATIAAAAGAGG